MEIKTKKVIKWVLIQKNKTNLRAIFDLYRKGTTCVQNMDTLHSEL